jgi:hypothetical protein
MERFDQPPGHGWRADACWFLACAVLSSIYCVTASDRLGATVDEPSYVQLGLARWRTGRHTAFLNAGTMPLSCEVQTLPLFLAETLRSRPFDLAEDWPRCLPWARAGNLLFWWLLLGYGGYLGRQLAGRWGGWAAMALLACEPNLLAHAGLATTDLALTACLVALLAHYRTGRVGAWATWRWRVGVPLLFAALTFLAKASGIVFVPLVLLAVEIERLARSDAVAGASWRQRLGRFLSPALLDGGQVLGGGFLIALVYFGFGSGNSFRGEWAQTHQPHGLFAHALWQFNQTLHSNALGVLVFQMGHQEAGHGGALLLGHWYPDGVWYYFPVALSLKLGLPLLLTLGLLAVMKPRALGNTVIAAAALLLLYSLNCRVQIGVRLFLPVVTLLGIGAAVATVLAAREAVSRRARGCLRFGALCALGWSLFGTLAIWPHPLCFANEAVGGPGLNCLNLGDSNHDWGQGVPELLAWRTAHGDAPLSVWYFGTDPQLRTGPLTPIDLAALPPEAAEERLQGRYLAVSTTLLYGGPGQSAIGERLRGMQPVGRTTTFVIYDFTRSEAVARSDGGGR